jgi:hypothetical protein
MDTEVIYEIVESCQDKLGWIYQKPCIELFFYESKVEEVYSYFSLAVLKGSFSAFFCEIITEILFHCHTCILICSDAYIFFMGYNN